MRKQSITLLAVLVAAIAALCGCAATTPETIVITQVVKVTQTPTDEPAATPTLEPTATETPAPTFTPRPTFTRGPTRTPLSTETPTPMPETIVYEGSGDDVVDVELPPRGSYLIHVIGNGLEKHFAIESYDTNNDKISLLVNTTDVYDGWQLFNLEDTKAKRLLVKAVGDWLIELVPIADIPAIREHIVFVPGGYEGFGDDVVLLKGDEPDTAAIVGNGAAHHFAVVSLGDYGRKLLVNTTVPYDGVVLLGRGTFAFEITAVGLWTIEIKGR